MNYPKMCVYTCVKREQKILIMLEYLMKNSGLFGRKEQKLFGPIHKKEKCHGHMLENLVKLNEMDFQINFNHQDKYERKNSESTEKISLPK